MEQEEILSTEVTEDDIKNGVRDEYDVVYSKDGKRLLKCTNYTDNFTSYTVKDGTEVICDESFASHLYLCHIIIPNSVMIIGNYAFQFCSDLQQIIIPNSVIRIGEGAFDSCASLQQINIPNSVKTIGGSAFVFCKSLQQITIPNSVATIGERIFAECTKLQQISIPNSVTTIGESAFESCECLQQITIPNSVVTIGDRIFAECHKLQQISIPDSITTIGNRAFENCTNLRKIAIPNTVTTIGEFVFLNCEDLQEIALSDSIKEIKQGAFLNCKSLQNIIIPNNVSYIGDFAFAYCKSMQQIIIPKNITSIAEGAFWGCKALQEVSFSGAIRYIGDGAFCGCKSLNKISLPTTVKIGNNAFNDCKFNLKSMIPTRQKEKIRIKKIVISNFRAFKQEKIEFKDFNCLIGKNDSGKSTIFAALEWFFDANNKLNENDFAAAGLDWAETSNPSYRDEITGEIIPEETNREYIYEDKSISVDVYFSGVQLPDSSDEYDYIFNQDFIKDGCICITKYMGHPYSESQRNNIGYSIKKYPLKEFGKIFSECSLEELIDACEKYDLNMNVLYEIINSLEKERLNQKGLYLTAINSRIRYEKVQIQKVICEKLFNIIFNTDNTIIDNQWIRYDKEHSSPFYLDWFDNYKLDIYTSKTSISQYLNSLLTPYNSTKIYNTIEDAKDRTAQKISSMLNVYKVSENVSFKKNEQIELFTENSLMFKQNELPISIPLKNRGEGLQLTIKKAVFELLAEVQAKDQNIIFAFEEPETHLHPSAQIEMYKSIKALSENSNYQVFMTTHSPYIVNELAKDANNNIIIVERDEQKKESYINKTVKKRVLPYESMNEINYIAFDEPSIAYHIELFGFIHNELMDKYENDSSFKNDWDSSIVAPDKNGVLVKVGVGTIKGVDIWLEVKNGAKKYNWYDTKSFTKEKRTLPYCVRNNIDHPLTKDDTSNINKHRAFVNNAKFGKYIKQSIDIMRNAIINNPNVFK